jgi:hypothetical protein
MMGAAPSFPTWARTSSTNARAVPTFFVHGNRARTDTMLPPIDTTLKTFMRTLKFFVRTLSPIV